MTGAEWTLFLLRHAKSSWEEPVHDHDRPLAARGVRDASAAGRLLTERGWQPDLVLCSTATRTQQTWARAVEAGAAAQEVRFTERIYAATATDLLRLVREVPADVQRLMLIGHGPGLPDLAERLAGDLPGKFATCALAVLRFDVPWAEIDTGRLVTVEVPRGR